MSSRAAPWLLPLLVLGGCGWHAGLPAPEEGRNVGVAAVNRDGHVLERGLEPLLTDALSRAVVDWVSLPLADPEHADLVVRCRILEYRRRSGVRNRDNEILETAVFLRAQAELYDRRKGRVRGTPVIAQDWSGYTLDQPTNEDEARDRALRYVAETLILDLFRSERASVP